MQSGAGAAVQADGRWPGRLAAVRSQGFELGSTPNASMFKAMSGGHGDGTLTPAVSTRNQAIFDTVMEGVAASAWSSAFSEVVDDVFPNAVASSNFDFTLSSARLCFNAVDGVRGAYGLNCSVVPRATTVVGATQAPSRCKIRDGHFLDLPRCLSC